MIGTDDRAIIKLYSGTLLQLFHVTWHIIIGQKGGVCTTYAMNPRNLKKEFICKMKIVTAHNYWFSGLMLVDSSFLAKYVQ